MTSETTTWGHVTVELSIFCKPPLTRETRGILKQTIMCTTIRTLRADEIDVKVKQFTKDGSSVMVLLYKDARCDMDILDEVFGMTGWKRRHEFKNNSNYCVVSIWDAEKKEWIDKEDVGSESNTEKEKGQASDAFKRACVNVGIGRELYTAPKGMWIKLNAGESRKVGDGYRINTTFSVSRIEYSDKREIKHIEIVDDKSRVRYTTYPQRRSFPFGYMKDADKRRELCEWIAGKEREHNAKNAGKKFNVFSLMEITYDITNDDNISVVQMYEDYKRNQAQ